MEALRPVSEARIILASASPRREQLLKQIGLNFEVFPGSASEEVDPSWSFQDGAERVALRKAEDVALSRPDADLIIAADTVVVGCDEVLGKPSNRMDAFLMLGKLSGRTHEVVTGYAVLAPREGKRVVSSVVTRVTFRIIAHQEIEAYVATGEPLDKAGAYAIQGLGGLFVERIEGCYPNVVGLPLTGIDRALRQLGWRIL
ncbi:MAG TPA: septum formation protein Maf [Cyanobacteria bacterium UBA8530]|nr:septum formation protein Maf [Cyanobacteria bacterium UBA8530]